MYEFLNAKKFLCLVCNAERAFFTFEEHKYNLWTCQKVTEALVYLLDKIILELALNFIEKN